MPAPATGDDLVVEDVAGYRVLRSAGHGDRARLLLGFDDGRTVVLKVTAAGDPGATVEIEALERAVGEHVVALDDVSSDERETVLVLERLPNGTLAELLERRRGLDAGEAVTVLAPIATTLDRIHAAGVAHGRLSLAAICFREDGAPVLTGFGGAWLFGAESPDVVLETVPGVLADRAALRDIAAIVLGRVVGDGAAAARRLAMQLADASPADVSRLVFQLATATSVRFDEDGGDVVAARVGGPHEGAPVEPATASVLPPWVSTLLPDWVRERIEEPAARVAAVWSGWQPRRRRLVVGVLAGVPAVLIAVALVPAAPAEPSVAAATPSPTASVGEAPALPEDPVAAAAALLATRDRCLRDLSLLCLDLVVQSGSAAHAHDMALVRAIQDGGEYPSDAVVAGAPVLVERLGDAALLDLPAGSEPASVLLMETADGWRIRDYPDAPTAPTAG